MPSLRFDQSNLKCKNGCDYFGNPQWQGYCSKCYREQLQRQKRAEKASAATLPKPEQKKTERSLKLASHSSFSKFEEKRLRQSETLKKANLLKFTVFKKSSTDEHDTPERKPPEFKIPSIVNENMKRDFRVRFPTLPPPVGRESRAFVHLFIMDVIKCANVMSVDELSERVQRHYQQFLKNMDASPHLTNVEPEVKEQLIDFVEKHAMTYLHDLPGVVFSPHGTEDERQDRAMSERIQQLSWLRETHLDCKLRASTDTSQLLYRAIGELLAMDAAPSPGSKLSRVRRACRHVLAVCGAHAHAPASADDLLPALIFTVLKANPPRLVSNINFVTRFCNAQRLMTGEGGYYFTNLCCAVSFIENLNAESLSMDKKEFDCYMAMPASIGGSTWAAALSLCGAVREADEQKSQAEKLMEEVNTLRSKAELLATNAETFEKEIVKKVQDVLAKTPLEIKPRREPPRLGTLHNSNALIDLSTPEDQSKQIQEEIPKIEVPKITSESIDQILLFEEKPSPPKSPQNQWDLKQSGSFELLTPSPLGFTPFDARSIDELMTPEDFTSDQAPGLSNINYDIDLSDLSNDNSLADDPKEPKDPFSPDALKKFDPFQPHTSQDCKVLEKFDEFSLINAKTNEQMESFEVVHRSEDSRDPFSPIQKETSILDDSGSPSAECFLPSPLMPQTSKPT